MVGARNWKQARRQNIKGFSGTVHSRKLSKYCLVKKSGRFLVIKLQEKSVLELIARNFHHPGTFSMEDEWEEEEQLVVVELSGIINNDFLSKCRGTCKIIDIDSERPMMQVGQYVFAGEYEDALGTCVLFKEEPQKGKADTGVPELKYICHTVKKLMMQRIFLTEKKEGETCTGSGDSGEQNDTTCQTNQEEDANQQRELDKDVDNRDLEDSAAG